ncbi:DUF4145 domain-containing protein [Blastococcus sp. SYSU DS0539]
MTEQVDYLLPRGQFQADMTSAVQVAMRCPHCRHQVLMQALMHDVVAGFVGPKPVSNMPPMTDWVAYGVRRCPRPECGGVVFVVAHSDGGELITAYPPETVDWDATNLPDQVLEAFQEAILCEANSCHRASALMTRRTLELVCADQGAGGGTLVKRLQALGERAVLPAALLAALDDLRLLGNDAAHVDARDYEQVGVAEVRLALDVAKELLKAVYQYDSLMARLAALKRPRE